MNPAEATGKASAVALAKSATWHAHYLSVLARRTALQPPAVQQALEGRIAALRHAVPRAPISAAMPASLSGPSDSPLAELTRTLEQRFGQAPGTDPLAPPAELQALRQSRMTWAKLSVDRQMAQAMKAAPENAGPLNSHFLALRALAALREISPDYLNRFVSYLDTLLCLDATVNKGRPAGKKSAKSKAGKR